MGTDRWHYCCSRRWVWKHSKCYNKRIYYACTCTCTCIAWGPNRIQCLYWMGSNWWIRTNPKLHRPSVHSDGSKYSHRLEHRCFNAKYISLRLTPSPLILCTHVSLNDEIFHTKLDTGAQINVMTESLFKCIRKTKSCHYSQNQISNWLGMVIET